MTLASSLCFRVLTSTSFGTPQIASLPSSLSFGLLTCSVLSDLAECKLFFRIFFSVFLYFFSEMQLMLNKLTSLYSDVLSLIFSSILILLMGCFSLAFVYLAITQITL